MFSSGKDTVSCIEVNGVKFFSDRLYLNTPSGITENFNGDSRGISSPLFCRSKLVASLDLKAVIIGTYVLDPGWIKKEFPSLFADRVNGDTDSTATREIPTLLLHGQYEYGKNKGNRHKKMTRKIMERHFLNHRKDRKRAKMDEELTPTTPILVNNTNKCGRMASLAYDNPNSNYNSQVKTSSSSDQREEDLTSGLLLPNQEDVEIPAEEGWRNESKDFASLNLLHNCDFVGCDSVDEVALSEDDDEKLLFKKSVFLTQILSTWVPPDVSSSTEYSKSVDASKIYKGATKTASFCKNEYIVKSSSAEFLDCNPSVGVPDEVIKSRKHCMGVYHPKFFLLFEQSGSLVVVVSTSNLNPQTSIEGSWVQRFFPRSKTSSNNGFKNDFGQVLANFLHAHGACAEKGSMTPQEFLKMFLGFHSLDNFCAYFDFDQADVFLISTVPGIYPSEWTTEQEENANYIVDQVETVHHCNILYGPQRLSYLISNLQTGQRNNKPWFPRGFLSKQDRLILQPTSISGNWNRNNFTDIARLYLSSTPNLSCCGNTKLYQPIHSKMNETDILEKVDIIWPSLDFFKDCRKGLARYRSRNRKIHSLDDRTLFVCLSSKIFNSLDVAFISRMKQFTSVETSLPPFLTPHIKTYARILEPVIDLCDDGSVSDKTTSNGSGNVRQDVVCLVDSPVSISPKRKKKDSVDHQREEYFAWFMLTSACLSRGAQGEEVSNSYTLLEPSGKQFMRYANFELGVLFCSRLQGNRNTDRLYACSSTTSVVENTSRVTRHPFSSSATRIILLPVPYLVRSPPAYQQDEDEADLIVTPYFHEIPEGTGAAGHMLLTPLGKQIASGISA